MLHRMGSRWEMDIEERMKLDQLDRITDEAVAGAIYRTKLKAWKRAGIDHVSNNHLETAATSFAKWYMSYIKGIKTESNPAMERGTQVEHAIFLNIMGIVKDVDECVRIAKNRFSQNLMLGASKLASIAKEAENLEPMIKSGIEFLAPYGKPKLEFIENKQEFTQPEASIKLDEVVVPCVGKMDALYPDQKLIGDLKTSARAVNGLTRSWQRQGAIYATSNPGYAMTFFVITPKGVSRIDQTEEEIKDGLNEATLIAQTVQRWLLLKEQPHQLAEIIIPDFSSFKMQDPEYQEAGHEIWGF